MYNKTSLPPIINSGISVGILLVMSSPEMFGTITGMKLQAA